MRALLLIFVLSAFPAPATAARVQSDETEAVVEVRGTGLVELEPDYAELDIGIQVSDDSVDDATTEMSRRLEAVSAAMVRLGIPADSVPATSFIVSPEYDFDDGRELRGFSADVALTVRTRDLDLISTLVEAVLEAGATSTSRIQFLSSESAEARDLALTRAFENAEREARVLAAASGHGLGPLLFVTTQPVASAYPALALDEVVVTGLAVAARRVQVSADVTARWSLAR